MLGENERRVERRREWCGGEEKRCTAASHSLYSMQSLPEKKDVNRRRKRKKWGDEKLVMMACAPVVVVFKSLATLFFAG